jgi:hypothetical protein
MTAARLKREKAPPLPELLPIDGAPVTQLERAETARDAAVHDLAQTHRLLSDAGVPTHVGGRPVTLTARVRMLLAAVSVGADERRVMVAVSRVGSAS